MKLTRLFWPSFLLFLYLAPTTSNGQAEILDSIVSYIPLGLSLVEHLYELGQKLFKDGNFNLDIDLGRGLEKEILKKIQFAYDILDQQSAKLDAVQNTLRELSHLPRVVRWQQRMDRLAEYMRILLSLDRTFHTYQAYREQLNPLTLENFAMEVVGHEPTSVARVLDYIHDLVVPYDSITGESLFYMQRNLFETNPIMMCSTKQSPHQLIYSLYNLITITEIKGYTMMHFSWLILQLHNKGNYSEEAKLARDDLLRRTREKAQVAREVMAKISSEYWRCDPEINIENTTFLQLTELLQGYIENEVDLNNHETCKETCSYYSYAKSEGCYKNLFCSKQAKCKGRVINCQFIDSDSTVCLSDHPHRRYDWVEYENGRVLGMRGSCSRSRKVDSWWRWLFWHCSYCFCYCDDSGPHSDRYFSLRSSAADVESNKIVTGMRFVKVKQIIHMQIQEAEALPLGGINETTISWRPIDSFTLSDAVNGKDYATLTADKRGLDLDDLKVPQGHVVTGVRFRQLGGNLNLEIQATGIDFKTGKLKVPVNLWVSNDNTPAAVNNPRKRLTIYDPDVPTHAVNTNMPDSKSGQYLEFTHSSLSKDVAQTTIPFLDAQPVTVDPPSWLEGIGIMHKGMSGFGGFVSFKIFTLNYTDHLESNDIDDLPKFDRLMKPTEGIVILKPNSTSEEDDRINEV